MTTEFEIVTASKRAILGTRQIAGDTLDTSELYDLIGRAFIVDQVLWERTLDGFSVRYFLRPASQRMSIVPVTDP